MTLFIIISIIVIATVIINTIIRYNLNFDIEFYHFNLYWQWRI
jgi:hypothetical protein